MTAATARAPRASTPAPDVIRSRPRPRAIDVDAETTNSVDEAKTLIEEFVAANDAKNSYAKLEREAIAKLQSHMAKNSMKTVRHTVDGQLREAEIAATEKTIVDINKLYGEVDVPTFLSIVSATQTAVKDKVGSVTLSKVSELKIGEDKLTVKKIKTAS